jgi:hypothetical protein
MNQAIKLNPNFSTAFADRGIAAYDRLDYDRAIVGADPLSKAKPVYAVSLSGRGASYENRRDGDRIIQDASLPIRNNQYNAYAYSPDTFPSASPLLTGGEPAKAQAAIPAPVPAVTPAPLEKTQASAGPAPKAAQEALDTAKDDDVVPMPQRSPKRPARPPAKESRAKFVRPPAMQPKLRAREALPHRAAISRADAWPRLSGRKPVRQ